MRRRKHTRVTAQSVQYEYGLNGFEIRRLADYNGERARGLVHTAEFDAEMAGLQARFDEAQQRLWYVSGPRLGDAP